MAHYNHHEKFDMLRCYLRANENTQDASNAYFALYPERQQPNPKIFQRLVYNLINYGAFNKPRSKTYRIDGQEEKCLNVVGNVTVDPNISLRQLENETGIARSSASDILKKHKFHPYSYCKIQRLREGDGQRRINFSTWYLNKLNENRNFNRKIIWTDESYVASDGIVNRYNKHYWADENPRATMERGIQQGRFGFSLWVALTWNGILAYQIYQEPLNGERYLNILRQHIEPFMENLPLNELQNMYFQQDGAPPHNTRAVTDFLRENFGRNWLGTSGPVRWPPRSPDLTPLDFFLWSHLKNNIYKFENENIDVLINNTESALRDVSRIHVQNAIRSVRRRCELCIEQNGLQFEQYL